MLLTSGFQELLRPSLVTRMQVTPSIVQADFATSTNSPQEELSMERMSFALSVGIA